MSIAVKGVRAGTVTLAVALVGVIASVSLRHHASAAELPAWFGDSSRPPVRIAGRVFGPTTEVTVRMWIDVPDPSVWPGREVTTSATGEFDFGPMRAGGYILLASGHGWLSRIVVVDTLREGGDRTELFAYEWRAIESKLEKFEDGEIADSDWARARWLSQKHERTPAVSAAPPMTGTVVRSDGSPAAFVGVVPIAQAIASHDRPHDMGIVTTTDADGRFRFVPLEYLRGFRILMGPRMHEVDIAHDRVLPEETGPFVVQLPATGSEQHGLFNPDRRDTGDPSGAWIRGRIVRAGKPVPEAAVTAFVPPSSNMEIYDDTRTRSDGSFELYVSSRDLDKCRLVVLHAGESLQRLSGRAIVALAPGETRTGLTIEIGAGLHVNGLVVDEGGRPVQGVRVGSERWWQLWSAATDAYGRFELTLGPQGRHRLHVFNEARAELQPLEGRLPQAIDVSVPDGTRDGVRIVVRRGSAVDREHFTSDWDRDGDVDLGADVKRNIVQAVGDELEAAGLRVNDELVRTDPPTPTYHTDWMDRANMVPQGQTTMFTVKRDGKQLDVRVEAPYFGNPSDRDARLRRLEECE